MNKQSWLRQVTMSLTSRHPLRTETELDKLEFLRLMDTHGADTVLRWWRTRVMSLDGARVVSDADPRRI